MITVRPSVPEDVPAQRELWKLAFGDSDQYIDNFYSTYYRPERVVVLEEDGAVRSMTAWFDTTFVVPGQGEHRTAYLYAVAPPPDCRGRGLAAALLAGADEYFCSLDIPAVTTVPAEKSLHDFFGSNGFRECFRVLGTCYGSHELERAPVPAPDLLRPASPEEYGRVREALLKDIPHIAYPPDALAYQAGCCALGDGGLFIGDASTGPMCLCAERASGELVILKEFLYLGRPPLPELGGIWQNIAALLPAQRWDLRQPRPAEFCVGVNEKLGRFGMLKWLDPALESAWDWDTVGYLGLAFD